MIELFLYNKIVKNFVVRWFSGKSMDELYKSFFFNSFLISKNSSFRFMKSIKLINTKSLF